MNTGENKILIEPAGRKPGGREIKEPENDQQQTGLICGFKVSGPVISITGPLYNLNEVGLYYLEINKDLQYEEVNNHFDLYRRSSCGLQ